MLKVGKDRIVDSKTGKERLFSYRDIEYDFDSWADASKYLPADCDLMHLKTETNTMSGWSCGELWDGLRLKPDCKVLYWKKQN